MKRINWRRLLVTSNHRKLLSPCRIMTPSDFTAYQAVDGLTAELDRDLLTVMWEGDNGSMLTGPANGDGGVLMDIPAGFRGGGMGRWPDNRSADHLHDRSPTVRKQDVQHPVQRGRQELGARRGLGCSPERRDFPAGSATITDDDRRLCAMIRARGRRPVRSAHLCVDRTPFTLGTPRNRPYLSLQ